MPSPSETRSQDSYHTSSQGATSGALDDTASSAQEMGPLPGVTVTFLSNTPNTAYQSRLRDVRARSVSPRPHRTISPIRLSVAQRHAQTVEHIAESAFSSVEVVADQTCRI